MVLIIIYLLLSAITIAILYQIIRVAVREGVLEALEQREQNRGEQK